MIATVEHMSNGTIRIILQSTTERDAEGFKLIPEFLPLYPKSSYATVYVERENDILGVTDDENGTVLTRNGEQPYASIHLFRRK